MEFNRNNKDNFGKILVIISAVLLLYIFLHVVDFSNLDWIFIHIDEYYTLGFIRFPVDNLITITANDVHPPLYYLILKIVTKISSILNLTQYNIIFLRLVSVIPYLIIIGISCTKIQKKYNWLTAGIFTFSLLMITDFSNFYFLIRMYSWSILFILLSFFSVEEILNGNYKKGWCMLTIFTILGAYTHYFVAISLVILYLSIMGYFLLKHDMKNLKLSFISTFIVILSYSPWLFVLFNQLKKVHNAYWIPPLDFYDLIDCLSYFAVPLEVDLILKVVAIVILCIILFIFVKEYHKKPSNENFYLLLGIMLFLLTALVGVVLSILFKPILIARYLIIPISALWFVLSIYIGQLENNKILAIVLGLIVLFGIIGFVNLDSYDQLFDKGIQDNDFLNELNDDDIKIICINRQPLILFGTYLDEADIYYTSDEAYGIDINKFNETSHVKYISNVTEVINNTNDTVYIIKSNTVDFPIDDFKYKDKYNFGPFHFYKIMD